MNISTPRTISTDGWQITPQLWMDEPPERTSFEIDSIVLSVEENGGRIKVKTEHSTFTIEEFRTCVEWIAEKFIEAYTLSRPKYFQLGSRPLNKSKKKVNSVIIEKEEGKGKNFVHSVTGETKAEAEFRIEGFDKDGNLTGDSFQTEFDENVDIVCRSMKVRRGRPLGRP